MMHNANNETCNSKCMSVSSRSAIGPDAALRELVLSRSTPLKENTANEIPSHAIMVCLRCNSRLALRLMSSKPGSALSRHGAPT